MSKTNDEQVAAILARGVARVRAMDAAGESMADGEQSRHVPGDDEASSERHGNAEPEAKR